MTTANIEWDDKLARSVIRKAIDSGSLVGARRVERLARILVPVGTEARGTPKGGKSWQSRKPGRLKRTIKAYKSRYKSGGAVVVAGSTDAFYARFVELGTPGTTARKRRVRKSTAKSRKRKNYRELSKKKRNSRTPIPPVFFMRKALTGARSGVIQDISEELKRELAK